MFTIDIASLIPHNKMPYINFRLDNTFFDLCNIPTTQIKNYDTPPPYNLFEYAVSKHYINIAKWAQKDARYIYEIIGISGDAHLYKIDDYDYIYQMAVMYGHIDTLKYIIARNLVTDYAIFVHSRIKAQVVKLLYGKVSPNILFALATYTGKLKIVKWAYSISNVTKAEPQVIYTGSLPILIFINNLQPFTREIVYQAAYKGHLHVVKHFYNPELKYPYILSHAQSHPNIIEWLKTNLNANV